MRSIGTDSIVSDICDYKMFRVECGKIVRNETILSNIVDLSFKKTDRSTEYALSLFSINFYFHQVTNGVLVSFRVGSCVCS